jgi:predicted SnoaL-like aldol condensation-catalyzing enzyme
MPISRIVLTFVAGALLATDAWAQQGRVMHPDAGCTATAAQLEANKKVAMAFFAPGADRVALADPSYKQHNPTASAGTWYEGFTFDVFRVRNGRLVEHWDGAVINPPAPAAGRGQ